MDFVNIEQNPLLHNKKKKIQKYPGIREIEKAKQ